MPLSLAIIDLDHFKLLNDTNGHQVGDDCLIRVGKLLKDFTNRPGDLCVIYGGEKFVLVWGDTPHDYSRNLTDKLLTKITKLNIPNKLSAIKLLCQ